MMLADELVGYFGDARVIVNDLLMHVEPLRPLWIPVNKHGSQCGNTCAGSTKLSQATVRF